MDAQEILVEHLREALRQLQRYLAAGLATALSLVLLALAPAGQNAPITVPVISRRSIPGQNPTSCGLHRVRLSVLLNHT